MSIDNYLKKINSSIDTILTKNVASNANGLYEMMTHHISNRTNPVEQNHTNAFKSFGLVCLISCQSNGGNWEKAIPAAIALEFINGFLEIHDDVAHGNPHRQSKESIWWKWGPAQAINAGDAMHSLARLTIFELKNSGIPDSIIFQILSTIDEACLKLCQSKFYDLEAIEQLSIDVEIYLQNKRSHHSHLYECAMSIGSIIAGSSEEIKFNLSEAGLELGTATTISNEMKLFWDIENQSDHMVSELLNKKKVLPVITAFSTNNASLKRRLGEIYLKRVLEPKDIVLIKSLLDEENIQEYCEKLLYSHITKYNTLINNCNLPQSSSEIFKEIIKILTDEKYF
tara:strand:- start:689 stop:1711 length:1023 start_codon:yes stop_codon:yes gene_type:complete